MTTLTQTGCDRIDWIGLAGIIALCLTFAATYTTVAWLRHRRR
jgi:hypothetical protein